MKFLQKIFILLIIAPTSISALCETLYDTNTIVDGWKQHQVITVNLVSNNGRELVVEERTTVHRKSLDSDAVLDAKTDNKVAIRCPNIEIAYLVQSGSNIFTMNGKQIENKNPTITGGYDFKPIEKSNSPSSTYKFYQTICKLYSGS